MKKDDRPLWPEIWMEMARIVSRRSYDEKLKVGTVIVACDNTQVLAIGYNGNYKGGPNEKESHEPGMSGFIHAELNAIIKLDYNFYKRKHLYTTHSPCRDCSKIIVNAGIARVVYDVVYRDTSGLGILRESGVEVMDLSAAVLDVDLRSTILNATR